MAHVSDFLTPSDLQRISNLQVFARQVVEGFTTGILLRRSKCSLLNSLLPEQAQHSAAGGSDRIGTTTSRTTDNSTTQGSQRARQKVWTLLRQIGHEPIDTGTSRINLGELPFKRLCLTEVFYLRCGKVHTGTLDAFETQITASQCGTVTGE